MAKKYDIAYEFWGVILFLAAQQQPDKSWTAGVVMHTNMGIVAPPFATSIGNTKEEALKNLQREILNDMERAWMNPK
jgi:hypothetical protein